jgi:uncharacterized protein
VAYGFSPGKTVRAEPPRVRLVRESIVSIMTTGVPLGRQECWALLRTVEIGRLCYTENAMPVVRPVPFRVDGTGVIAAVGATATLYEVFRRPSIVAFEAGEWTPGELRGWSVQAVGKAQTLPRPTVADHIQHELAPWIDGAPAHFVCVELTVLTGQQVDHTASGA